MSEQIGGGDAGSVGEGGAPSAPVVPVTPASDWRTSIPEEYRAEPSLAQIKDIGGLVKSYVHAQKMVGTDKIPMPNEAWNQAQWDEHYARIGRPEAPDQYSKLAPEKLAASGLDPKVVEGLYDTFHKAGLTNKQATTLAEQYVQGIVDSNGAKMANMEAEAKTAMDNLTAQFGEQVNQKLDIAQTVVRQFGGEGVANTLNETGLGNNPDLINMFIKMGEAMMEDRADGSGPGLSVTDATNAAQKIKELKMDMDFQKKLGNRDAIGHAIAVSLWTDLHNKAYPASGE